MVGIIWRYHHEGYFCPEPISVRTITLIDVSEIYHFLVYFKFLLNVYLINIRDINIFHIIYYLLFFPYKSLVNQ